MILLPSMPVEKCITAGEGRVAVSGGPLVHQSLRWAKVIFASLVFLSRLSSEENGVPLAPGSWPTVTMGALRGPLSVHSFYAPSSPIPTFFLFPSLSTYS